MMLTFEYRVTVKTDTLDHAAQVMGERLGFDEQYEDEEGVKFAYTLSYLPAGVSA